jgi:hypothetical protein
VLSQHLAIQSEVLHRLLLDSSLEQENVNVRLALQSIYLLLNVKLVRSFDDIESILRILEIDHFNDLVL